MLAPVRAVPRLMHSWMRNRVALSLVAWRVRAAVEGAAFLMIVRQLQADPPYPQAHVGGALRHLLGVRDRTSLTHRSRTL